MIMEKRKPSMVAPPEPLVCDDAGGPAQHAGESPAVDMGYVHGVNLADELDEVEGFAGAASCR